MVVFFNEVKVVDKRVLGEEMECIFAPGFYSFIIGKNPLSSNALIIPLHNIFIEFHNTSQMGVYC
jgi:hypothetical protein|tara:strand:+ start:2150 stop:2344 length:195 start_codon:yes stop_codon:yes gene_type:complete